MADHLEAIVIAAYCGGLALLVWGVVAGWRAIGRARRREQYLDEKVLERIRRLGP